MIPNIKWDIPNTQPIKYMFLSPYGTFTTSNGITQDHNKKHAQKAKENNETTKHKTKR